MKNLTGNIFSEMPTSFQDEHFQEILTTESIRIERIVSRGHTSPDNGWYDQAEHEWVIVLKGAGIISFEDGKEIELKPGDYLNIPAHAKHKVIWTDQENETVWLAIFYN